jgi:serine/threonine-protein kinase
LNKLKREGKMVRYYGMHQKLIGEKIHNFEIIKELGNRDQGIVYQAKHLTFEDIAVFRVFPKEFTKEWNEILNKEAKKIASMTHPHIVKISDVGVQSDFAYVRGEYIEKIGREERRNFSLEEVLRIICDILDALEYAHDRGVIHRRIHPDNVLINKERVVKIDFCLLECIEKYKILRREIPQSSNLFEFYISPEEKISEFAIEKVEVTPRTDIYSVGVMLYEMLTEKFPLGYFKPPSEFLIKKKEINKRILSGIDDVLRKALQYEPRDRYRSARDMREELKEIMGMNEGVSKLEIESIDSGEIQLKEKIKRKPYVIKQLPEKYKKPQEDEKKKISLTPKGGGMIDSLDKLFKKLKDTPKNLDFFSFEQKVRSVLPRDLKLIHRIVGQTSRVNYKPGSIEAKIISCLLTIYGELVSDSSAKVEDSLERELSSIRKRAEKISDKDLLIEK